MLPPAILALNVEGSEYRAGPGCAIGALSRQPLKTMAGTFQRGDLCVKFGQARFGHLMRAVMILPCVQGDKFADFLKREPRLLRLADKAQTAQSSLP